MKITLEKLRALERALGNRDVPAAEQIVQSFEGEISRLSPLDPHAALALDLLARWVDFEPAFLPRIASLPARFGPSEIACLSTLDLAHLDNALGLFHLFAEQSGRAQQSFERVIEVADRIQEPELMSIARYYLGRAYWRKADYLRALELAGESKRTGTTRQYPERIAVIEMMEGWLHYLLGNSRQARELLERADLVLQRTQDFINHGNALSFRGQLARRRGDYRDAVEFFERSIEAFARRDPHHRNLARSHSNIAFVRHLQLMHFSEQRPGGKKRRDAAQLAALCRRAEDEARMHLKQAEEIYQRRPESHVHGRSSLHIIRALLSLDLGRLEEARREAGLASALGKQAEDQVVLANSMVLRAIIERRDGNPWEALYYANQAVEHAERTTNRRARGRAQIWKGIILAEDTFRDPAAAEECRLRAADLLMDDRDYLAVDLRRLEEELMARRRPPALLQVRLSGLDSGLHDFSNPWQVELKRSDFVPSGPDTTPECGRKLQETLEKVERSVVVMAYEMNARVKSRVYALLPRRLVDKHLPTRTSRAS